MSHEGGAATSPPRPPKIFVPDRALPDGELMVKDSTRYAATGGWGFGKFVAGMPVGEAEHKGCLGCHEAHVNDHDFGFTRFAP